MVTEIGRIFSFYLSLIIFSAILVIFGNFEKLTFVQIINAAKSDAFLLLGRVFIFFLIDDFRILFHYRKVKSDYGSQL